MNQGLQEQLRKLKNKKSLPCSSGGTGRRAGFKIQFFGVWVRFPPRVRFEYQIQPKPCKYQYLQGFSFYLITFDAILYHPKSVPFGGTNTPEFSATESIINTL